MKISRSGCWSSCTSFSCSGRPSWYGSASFLRSGCVVFRLLSIFDVYWCLFIGLENLESWSGFGFEFESDSFCSRVRILLRVYLFLALFCSELWAKSEFGPWVVVRGGSPSVCRSRVLSKVKFSEGNHPPSILTEKSFM